MKTKSLTKGFSTAAAGLGMTAASFLEAFAVHYVSPIPQGPELGGKGVRLNLVSSFSAPLAPLLEHRDHTPLILDHWRKGHANAGVLGRSSISARRGFGPQS